MCMFDSTRGQENGSFYYNDCAVHEGKYYLMRDTDRFSDEEFDSLDDARDAMDEAYYDDFEDLWIGIGEDQGGTHIEIIFVEGEPE